MKLKCPEKECEYEWDYKPYKHTKIYYVQCPQCRKYHDVSVIMKDAWNKVYDIK